MTAGKQPAEPSQNPLVTATPLERWGCLVPMLVIGALLLAVAVFVR